MAHDQNAADRRIDDVQDQRQLHLFLANYCCEWERPAHMRTTDYTDFWNSYNYLD